MALESTIRERIKKAIQNAGGIVTVGDVVAQTGLPTEKAKTALLELVSLFSGHMRVSERGEIVFVFSNDNLNRRITDTLTILINFSLILLKILAKIIKYILIIIIFGYFVFFGLCYGVFFLSLTVFVFIPFYLLYLLFSLGDDPHPLRHVFRLLALPLIKVVELIKYLKEYGLPDRLFHRFAYQFIFGPQEAKKPSVDYKVRDAQLIRSYHGVLCTEDWVLCTGQTKEQCENDLAKYSIEFGGDIQITDNGNLVYVFKDLMQTTKDFFVSEITMPWDELLGERELTGNTETENKITVTVILVSFMCSALMLWSAWDHGIALREDLFFFISPFVVLCLSLLIPLARIFVNKIIHYQRYKKALRLFTLKALYNANREENEEDDYEDFFTTVEGGCCSLLLYNDRIKRDLRKSIAYWENVLQITFDRDEKTISFSNLLQRTQDASELRDDLDLENQDIGNIIFSTAEDEEEQAEKNQLQEDLEDFDEKLLETEKFDEKQLEANELESSST